MKWLTKRLGQPYVDRLIEGHLAGNIDDICDREVRQAILVTRWRWAAAPWLALFISTGRIIRVGWEIVNGRHRKPCSQVHGGAAQATGQSAGAGYYSAAAPPGPIPGPVAPQSFEDAGVRAGEVVAYRCWVLKEDGLLYSIFQSEFVWQPDEVIEGEPTTYGEGVHGFKDRLSAVEYIAFNENNFGRQIVSGTVDLWGDVFEHQRGYRASKAAIASIDDSPNYDAAALRKLYLKKKRSKK